MCRVDHYPVLLLLSELTDGLQGEGKHEGLHSECSRLRARPGGPAEPYGQDRYRCNLHATRRPTVTLGRATG